jgi:hypothetical protein
MLIRNVRAVLLMIATAGALFGCSSADPGISENDPAAGADSVKEPSPGDTALSPVRDAPAGAGKVTPDIRTCDQYFTGKGGCEEICCTVIVGEPEDKWPCTVSYGPCP